MIKDCTKELQEIEHKVHGDRVEGIWRQILDVFKGGILADWYVSELLPYLRFLTFSVPPLRHCSLKSKILKRILICLSFHRLRPMLSHTSQDQESRMTSSHNWAASCRVVLKSARQQMIPHLHLHPLATRANTLQPLLPQRLSMRWTLCYLELTSPKQDNPLLRSRSTSHTLITVHPAQDVQYSESVLPTTVSISFS